MSKQYDENKYIYEAFCKKLITLIEEIITNEGVPTHSITGRVKEKESLLKKIETKGYKEIKQITDIIGIRVITFVLDDVDKICDLLKKEFTIDDSNSGNKAHNLKDNETGYLSVHSILKLGPYRCDLPEYVRYKDFAFEIQVRTILQHAWASMSHDNQYKFTGVLPSKINRRFYLTAGTLEWLDMEFQRLTDELNEYKEIIAEETQKGNLNIEINSTSLLEYLNKRFGNFKDKIHNKSLQGYDEHLISELERFGIKYLSDLDIFLSDEIVAKIPTAFNYCELLMFAMILVDAEKYFANCWSNAWIFSEYDVEKLSKHVKGFEEICDKYNVEIIPF